MTAVYFGFVAVAVSGTALACMAAVLALLTQVPSEVGFSAGAIVLRFGPLGIAVLCVIAMLRTVTYANARRLGPVTLSAAGPMLVGAGYVIWFASA